jgi:DNA-3-methyladenine glycosylase II
MKHKEGLRLGVEHVRAACPVMRLVIDAHGPITLRPARDRFAVLVRSIISQQISTAAAARTIRGRLETHLNRTGVTPAALAKQTVDKLRAAGISRQKATYLIDLAQKVNDGTVPLATIGRLSDEEVIAKLTQIKGIGRWTAEMFLIFSLGRMDVLPVDDLGVRSALKRLHGLDDLPTKQHCVELAAPWRPYATIGSWYCWRSLDVKVNGVGTSIK